MEVKNSLDGSHLALGGRYEESRIRRKTHQYDHHGGNQDFLLQSTTLVKRGSIQSLILPEDILRKAIAPSKKRRRTPAGNPASPSALRDSGPAAPRSPPCWRLARESAAARAAAGAAARAFWHARKSPTKRFPSRKVPGFP